MADPTASLADVIATSRLWREPQRPTHFEAEMLAMRRLADIAADSPSAMFQACAEAALQLCRADTAGVRLCTRSDGGEEAYRWAAVAGRLRSHLWSMSVPKDLSPSNICVVTAGPLLLDRPERVFKFLESPLPFLRALLVPMVDPASGLVGAIWTIAHTPGVEFDGEDARVLQRLALFTSTAAHMARETNDAIALAEASQLAFDELDHRVKNVLQITANLLEIELDEVSDESARAAILAARQRMLTLTQIHGIGENVEKDDLARIAHAVCDVLEGPHLDCEIAVDAPEPVPVSGRKATVAALIVNELVTNAIKHAFRAGAAGAITVRVRRTDLEGAELSVTDNGPPLPPDFASGNTWGRGMNLVRGLAHQLGGELRIDAPAKRFSVAFATDNGIHEMSD